MTEDPKTDAQASYLKTLCEQHGGEFDDGLTKAEASERMISCRGNVWLLRRRFFALPPQSTTTPAPWGRFGRCQTLGVWQTTDARQAINGKSTFLC